MPKDTAHQNAEAEPVIGTLALQTLSGDIRDRLMSTVRRWTKFDKLSESEQQDIIDDVTGLGESTAKEAMLLVHGRSLPTLGMKVVSAQRKGRTMRVTIEAPFTKNGWAGFGDCEEIVVVQAEPEIYFGARRPLRAEPDQPDLMDQEADPETGEILDGETSDDLAATMQAEAMADGELGPEAIENGELLKAGIGKLDTGDTADTGEMSQEELDAGDDAEASATGEIDTAAAAPTKRRRRTVEERVADNLASAEQEPPAKRSRRKADAEAA